MIAMILVTHHRFRGGHTINTLSDVLQQRWLLLAHWNIRSVKKLAYVDQSLII